MAMVEKLKTIYRNSSIKSIVIIVFLIFMLATIGVTSYITYGNWIRSANDNINKIMLSMNKEIISKIDSLVDLPLRINESNYNLLEKEVIDIHNEVQRERFFVGVLTGNAEEPIYSFSYGTETGEYYGARKNENNEIEIMRNNELTGGNSWYYTVTGEMKAGQLAVKAGEFDPRTRDWYKVAEEKGKPSFSPIYKHFIMEDLTISASYPIYNNKGRLQGVLGSHIILSNINDYLKTIVESHNATALIAERETGELLANTFGIDNFKTLEDGMFKRLNVEDLGNEIFTEAFSCYKTEGNPTITIESRDGTQKVSVEEYNKEGLNWLIITVIPESLLMADIVWNMKLTVILIVIALLFFISIYLKLIGILFKPIKNLISATEKFAAGDLKKRVIISRTDEVGRIAVAFNTMADTISHFIDDLESMVKERTHELEVLSYTDSLTGLYNRVFFETELKRLDKPRNLPISIITSDVNGLKLINDIFGHETGDMLIKKAAETFKKACRGDDIIARVGGDEFAILLPNTNEETANTIIERILAECSKEQITTIKCSIAIGSATKIFEKESIMTVLKESEDRMYKDKTLNRKSIAQKQMESIIDTLHRKGTKEKEHSENVSNMSVRIGMAMGLNDEEIKILKDTGYFHDIGKVVLDPKIINNMNSLDETEKNEMLQHPAIGYRILNTFDETMDLSQYVLTHHENWDGTGYPKGLKGEEIPKLSRILAIAEDFDRLQSTIGTKKAAAEIISESGRKYEPQAVDAFIKVMKNEKGSV
jgi:diguanylate cyclase (GGDEF)-like protein